MKRKPRSLLLGLALLLLAGCRPAAPQGEVLAPTAAPTAGYTGQMASLAAALSPGSWEDNYGSTYEIFVYSFCDSDGDGVGDLNGVREKLPYIRELGFSQIWLTPIFPSPTYHKYDAADYTSVDPAFGTMEDLERLLQACHESGLKLILDLALNHTSTEHPWFLAAKERLLTLSPEDDWNEAAADCPYLAYYNFSDHAQGGYESLGNGWYYEARFWSGMPDLNLSNERVKEEIAQVAQFWLGKGLDGFRLDALTSYYTENRGESIAFLSWFAQTVYALSPEAYLVGEAWTDQSAYAPYYASGIVSLFDFAFSGDEGIICSIVRGNRSAAVYAQAMAEEEALYENLNPGYINAPFYTNHDMARSAGYYAYDDGSKTKLAQGLNLLMPGNAFLYYGEEIGMRGSGKDENKRAPMYWSDTEGSGLCAGPEGMDEVKMKSPPADQQREEEYSIYTYVKTALTLRNSFPAIARGRTTPLPQLSDDQVCAFLRTWEGESLLIACNMGGEAASLSLTGEAAAYTTLAAVLLVEPTPVTLSEGRLTLPPYGIALLLPA